MRLLSILEDTVNSHDPKGTRLGLSLEEIAVFPAYAGVILAFARLCKALFRVSRVCGGNYKPL
jgi:hypothetical protein